MNLNATVIGNGNIAVNWSLSPHMGSISSSGVYTTPNTIPPQRRRVVLTATSVADSSASASASITLGGRQGSLDIGPVNAPGTSVPPLGLGSVAVTGSGDF